MKPLHSLDLRQADKFQRLIRPLLLSLSTCIGAMPLSSQAANWVAGAGNWNDPAKWGGTVPGINDAANFYSTGTATVSDTRFANTSDFGRTANSAQMDITSTGSLTLGGSGSGGVHEGTIWMAWVHSTTGADSSIINVNGGSFQAINVDSGMQRDNDHTGIHVTNGGSFTATNRINWNINGGLTGQTQDITIDGAGSTFTVANTMDLRGTDDLLTLTGGATLNAGNLLYDARDDSVFSVAGTSTLIVGEGTITDGLDVTGGALVQLDGGGTGTLTTNGLTGTGTVESTSGAGTSTLTVGQGDASSTFSGTIQENSGTLNLVKTGTGTLTLDTANTYSGTTLVSDGRLQIENDSAAGTGAITVDNANAGANLLVGDGVTLSNDITVEGNGGGTVKLDNSGAGTATFTGAVTFDTLNRIGNSNGTLQFDGAVDSPNSTQLFIDDAVFNGTLDLTGFELWQHVSDTTFNTTGNSWNQMVIGFGGSTTIGVDNALDTDGGIDFGWSNAGNGTATLNLNGFNQEVGYIKTRTLDAGANQNITGGGTLTVNQASGTREYQGRITDGATPTALVKTGAGTLVLNNLSGTPHNYTGGTTVNAGILSLGDGTTGTDLPDAGGFTIATGAVLDLNYTGTDTVNLLILGGSVAAAGTWGASGSGADNIDDTFFTGAGTLTVTFGSIYDVWADANALVGPDAATTADLENPTPDGMDNLLEFGIGTDPKASDNVPLTVTDASNFTPGQPIVVEEFTGGNPVKLKFVRRKDHATAGLTYTPEFMDSAATFFTDPGNPTPVVVSTMAGDYEVVQVPFPLFDSAGKKPTTLIGRVAITLE